MTKFAAVIFDLDGTLVDTGQHILQAFNYSLRAKDLKEIDLRVLASIAGIRLAECYKRFGANNEEEVSELIDLHKEFQQEHMELVRVFPRAREVLEQLRRKKILVGVVTSRYRKTTPPVIERVGLQGFFDALVCGEDCSEGKPSPVPFLECAKRLGVVPNSCLSVGDACADTIGAHAAGMKAALAAYGYGALHACEEKPDYVINELAEVLKLIE